ncbi:MAG: DUF3148 domain-containing protein [Gloeomargaritaceae cyanobacterium C42_A2020_066]|nr:DUF3148 domain-containing protein [Gloeomargaritaceae cyanobacterium C42_A2020_066]
MDELQVGQAVCVVTAPLYWKTADPMPMLRPPDTVAVGEVGTVVDRRPAGYWAVRFNRGVFLVESRHLAAADSATDSPQP